MKFTTFSAIALLASKYTEAGDFEARLKAAVQGAGATGIKPSISFFSSSGSNCNDCVIKDNRDPFHLFSSSEKNSIVCDVGKDCLKARISATFTKAWQARYFSITSSSRPMEEDPAKVEVLGLDDNNNWKVLVSEEDPFTSTRNEETFLLIKDTDLGTFTEYAIDITKKEQSDTISFNSVNVVDNYLKPIVGDISQDVLGLVLFQPSKFVPKAHFQLGIIRKPTPQYIINFNIFLHSVFKGWENIALFTQTGNGSTYFGDRMPSFWGKRQKSKTAVHFSSIDKNRNSNHYVDVEGLKLNEDNTFKVKAIGSAIEVYVNGNLEGTLNQHYSLRPTNDKELKVYTGYPDSKYGVADITLSNLMWKAVYEK